jgi:hypothetical protein
MMATQLLDKSVVVRELMPADLKLEADSMTCSRNQPRTLSRVCCAHGRQMD